MVFKPCFLFPPLRPLVGEREGGGVGFDRLNIKKTWFHLDCSVHFESNLWRDETKRETEFQMKQNPELFFHEFY